MQFFGTFQIENFIELSKFKVFWNCPNWKTKKFRDISNLKNQSLAPKIANFEIVRPFDIPHHSQFCQFSYLPFVINQFRRFNFSTFISYSGGNSLDRRIHEIIRFMKLFNFENLPIFTFDNF